MFMRLLFSLLTVVLMASCNTGFNGDNEAKATATQWAEAYFNCDFKDAANYTTPESERWLRFAASNTTEEDLKLVNGGATASAEEYFTVANDTLRVVTVSVRNFLKATAIGAPAEIQQEGTFLVTVVHRNGEWKVRMEGLPRNEKQNRD
jgi:hypothetical protein